MITTIETTIKETINEITQEPIIEINKKHTLYTAIKTIADIQRMTIGYRLNKKLTVSQHFENYIKVENGILYFVSRYSIVWTDDPAIVKNDIQDGIYMITKNINSLIQLIRVNNNSVIYPNFMNIINDNIKFDENDDKVDNFYLYDNDTTVLSRFIYIIYQSLLNDGNQKKIAVDVKYIDCFIKNLKYNNVSFAHKKNNNIFYLECKDKKLHSIFCGYDTEKK